MCKVTLRKTSLILIQTFLCFAPFFYVFTQSDVQFNDITIIELKSLSDSVYGSDHELINGKLYYQKNLYASGTPFYKWDDWANGSVKINGRLHRELDLKYNIETDELILKANQQYGISSPIVLNSPFVESFDIADDHFVNSDQLSNDDIKTDFVHVIYSGNLTLLVAYRKDFVNDYNTKTPFGRYSKLINVLYVLNDDDLIKISSKSSFIDLFTGHEKAIKKFMKKNKFRFKKAGSKEWYIVMTFCDNLISVSE